jgi:preprotein translocase subunit SecF
MIEIFKNTNYDFLGKKWICISVSCVLLLLGVASIVWRGIDGNPSTHPFNMGVDFTGGTIVNVKFKQKPDPDVIRAAIDPHPATQPARHREPEWATGRGETR